LRYLLAGFQRYRKEEEIQKEIDKLERTRDEYEVKQIDKFCTFDKKT